MGEHGSSKKKVIIAIVIILVLLLLLGLGVYFYTKKATASAPIIAPNTTTVPPSTTPPPSTIPTLPATPVSWACKKHPANNSANIVKRDANGFMECLGPDGKNCYWYASVDACNADISNQVGKSSNQELDCGTNVIPLYGDLRGDPTNWCYTARTDV